VLVEVAERFLDRERVDSELRKLATGLAEEFTHRRGEPAEVVEIENGLKSLGLLPNVSTGAVPALDPQHWGSVAHLVYFPFAGTTPYYRRISKEFHSVELLREVFGNPFRAIQFEPDWLDRNVMGIARGMRATRDFSAMPVLADALQDAGCTHPHVLDHCRGPNEHVRGCWVIEGLLRARKRGEAP